MRKLLCVVAAGALVGGCADTADTSPTYDGPTFNLEIGALELSGVDDAIWDVQVVNAANEPVWSQRISSGQYGDGAGSASYVGPCDASGTYVVTAGTCDPAGNDNAGECTAGNTGAEGCEENEDCDVIAPGQVNTVNVWLRGVYSATVPFANVGSFTDGATVPTANLEEINNPGVLSKPFVCTENSDTFVEFNVVVMRPARQGFFDIAVNFNNIYCSAKFDCEYGIDDPILLLHNPGVAGSPRQATYVLGLACTSGVGTTGFDTVLYMTDVTVSCDAVMDGETEVTPAYSLSISPVATDGNYRSDTVVEGNPVTTWQGVTGTTNPFYQIASYRGAEQLAGYNKIYANMAFGVGAATLENCTLTMDATADNYVDQQTGSEWLGDNMTIPSGTVYPFVQWNIELDSCTQHPLDGTGANAGVATRYTASIAPGDSATNPFGAKQFGHTFNP